MKPHTPRQFVLLPVFFAALVSGLVGCAEVAPPPGGPVDKTAPQLVATTPVNGSVDVAPDNKISIVFSERIIKPVSGRPVFISPRPQTEPDISWKADRIEITLEDGFAPDQTYLVSVASSVADQRGNKLDSTITIAFSTGPTLDSGKVSGRVVQSNGSGARNTYVALYDSTALADSVVYDSLYPAYLTLTNEDGQFSLQYLPPQAYRLIAFVDKNRDELFNPRREQFAVPDRPIVVGGEVLLSDLTLPLTQLDTTRADILAASITDNGLVRLRLTKKVPLSLLSAQPANARLIAVDDSLEFIVAEGFAESHLEESDALQIYFGDSITAGRYRIEVTYDAALAPLVEDSFAVEKREDNMPPEIVRFTPPEGPQFIRDIDIALAFSEPLDQSALNEETFLLLKDSVNAIPVATRWRDPFHLELLATLEAGAGYTLDIAEFDLLDHAGNALGDSLTQYRFATLDTDSLGSISGTVVVLVPGRTNDEVLLTFAQVGSSQEYELPVSGRSFRIDLPAGKYVLSGFVDSNGNGEKDAGSVQPFEFSESRAVLADTVAVRARFETAGIEFLFK